MFTGLDIIFNTNSAWSQVIFFMIKGLRKVRDIGATHGKNMIPKTP